jgi:hypothetical protein
MNIDTFKHKNPSQNCPHQTIDNKDYFNCFKHDGSVGFCNFCMLVKTKLASLEVDVGSKTYLALGSGAQSGLVKAKARGF